MYKDIKGIVCIIINLLNVFLLNCIMAYFIELQSINDSLKYTDEFITYLIKKDLERNDGLVLNFYSTFEGHMPYFKDKYEKVYFCNVILRSSSVRRAGAGESYEVQWSCDGV